MLLDGQDNYFTIIPMAPVHMTAKEQEGQLWGSHKVPIAVVINFEQWCISLNDMPRMDDEGVICL